MQYAQVIIGKNVKSITVLFAGIAGKQNAEDN
jgi:hypothetical protein